MEDSSPEIKADSDSRQPPLSLMIPPTDDSNKSASRPTSPSVASSTQFKLATQMARLKAFKTLMTTLPNMTTITRTTVKARMEHVYDLWKSFHATHEELGSGCRSTLMRHDYILNDVYGQVMDMHQELAMKLFRLLEGVEEQSTQQTTQQSTLPEIKLPTFSGDHSEWPAFRDMFSSLVIDRQDLTDVTKLHYLLTHLDGLPKKLLQGVAIVNSSFKPAWQQLKQRFEDKERLIFTHIEKIFSTTPCVSNSPQQLDQLVGEVRQNVDALKTLQVPVDAANYFLVYIVTSKLDSVMREAWELKRSNSQQPTTLDSLLNFISTRARALEMSQCQKPTPKAPDATQSTQSTRFRPRLTTQPQPAPKTTHTSLHGAPKKRDYPCDKCGSMWHYITDCPEFLKLAELDRHRLVLRERLCFNCLGHHSIQKCQSRRLCNKCGKKHHTMIHGPRSAAETQQ